MAIDSQHIYWTNPGSGTIGRANLDGTAVNERFITGAGNFPTRVAVDGQHVYWTTWTMGAVPSTGTIGEANLDGTNVNNNLIFSANSPVGVAVTAGSVSGGGAVKCLVPNANGKKLAAAKKAIVKAHCAVGKVSKKRSKHVRKGNVISESPGAGKSLPSGTKVTLVVSR